MATTIEWTGGSSVAIKGPGDRCFINPPEKDLGKKRLTNKGGVSLIGYQLEQYADTYEDPHLIATPGEYDIGGFFVVATRGESTTHRAPNLFVVRYERRTIGYIDTYAADTLNDKDLETLGTIEILILPLDTDAADGGIDVAKAVRITNQIDPRIVVPIDRSGGKGTALKAFQKEMGAEGASLDSLTVKQNETLDEEDTQIVVLKPSA